MRWSLCWAGPRRRSSSISSSNAAKEDTDPPTSNPEFLALRCYATTYFSIVVAFALLAGLGLQLLFGLFLWRAGEFSSLDEVVARQFDNAAIYGSAIHEDGFEYKLELAAAAKPAIIALGSSRVLQFRQSDFSEKFINAGRGMITPAEGLDFMRALTVHHKPKIVIIGADFWWFNPNWPYPRRQPRNTSLDLATLNLAESWLWQGKISLPDLWRVAVLGDVRNQLTWHDNIGIAAIKRGNGYRPDGSRDYGLRYSGGDATFDDQAFANTLARIEVGEAQFKYAGRASAERFRQLDLLLEFITSAGITPIVVLPPLSRHVLDAMAARGPDYGYFSDIAKYADELKTEAYDFTEPESLGAGDCEFVDGFHGGEVIYQRITANIVAMNPNSALAPYVDPESLNRAIQQGKGHALSQASAGNYTLAESDFLRIGCHKGS